MRREEPEPEGIPGSELSVLALVVLPLIEVSHWRELGTWGDKLRNVERSTQGEEALGALNAANLRFLTAELLSGDSSLNFSRDLKFTCKLFLVI